MLIERRLPDALPIIRAGLLGCELATSEQCPTHCSEGVQLPKSQLDLRTKALIGRARRKARQLALNHSVSLGGVDSIVKLGHLVDRSLVGSELVAAELSGLLLLDLDTGTDELHGSLLEGVPADDFPDDRSDGGRALGDLALAGDGSSLPGLLGRGFGDGSVVASHEESGFGSHDVWHLLIIEGFNSH